MLRVAVQRSLNVVQSPLVREYAIHKHEAKKFFDRVAKFKMLKRYEKKGPPQVNNTFLRQRIESFKGPRRWKHIYLMYRKLVDRHAHPTVQNYRHMLYAVGIRGGAVKEAFEIFRRMQEVYPNDSNAYNIMIKVCALSDVKMNDDREDYLETNSLTKAMQLWEEMKQKEIKPNSFTFGNLLLTYVSYKERLPEGGKIEHDVKDIISDIRAVDPVLFANPHIWKHLEALQITKSDIDPKFGKFETAYQEHIANKNAFF